MIGIIGQVVGTIMFGFLAVSAVMGVKAQNNKNEGEATSAANSGTAKITIKENLKVTGGLGSYDLKRIITKGGEIKIHVGEKYQSDRTKYLSENVIALQNLLRLIDARASDMLEIECRTEDYTYIRSEFEFDSLMTDSSKATFKLIMDKYEKLLANKITKKDVSEIEKELKTLMREYEQLKCTSGKN